MPSRNRPFVTIASAYCVLLAATAALAQPPAAESPENGAQRLITGKGLSPVGTQTRVGSFPSNLVVSPDGKFVLVTDLGAREYVTALRITDGRIVSKVEFDADSDVLNRKKQALYYGLVCGPAQNGLTPVYVARGAEGEISILSLDGDGRLTDNGKTIAAGAGGADGDDLPFIAGLAISADGATLYAADNDADPRHKMQGSLRIVDVTGKKLKATVPVSGYPYAVAALTAGKAAGQKVYITSEQRGTVTVVNPTTVTAGREISTGAQPIGLLLDRAQARLFVANAGSDTVSVIDTGRDRVVKTILLRPDDARGLPGATPTGMALSPDEKRLYVTLADMNAVAVVSLPEATLTGYIPVGWYPTAVGVSPDGSHLFVSNAKGVALRNPNDKPLPGLTTQPQYIQNIIEGTVTTIDLAGLTNLAATTAQVLANNRSIVSTAQPFQNPGIKHVFYLIKENRTYDQILGDDTRGNGDPAVTLFGKDVTPNQHALADRFVLLDNFYCCAEVSGDGWNWSTGGMASEYVARNVPHSYTGRQREYDFEGTNNGVAVDRVGIPDAAAPAGGYLWDLCARNKVDFRNYGFFVDDSKVPRKSAEEGTEGLENSPTKMALVGHTDSSFRQFDLTYTDSDAWVTARFNPAPRQKKAYGPNNDPSRFSAWKREFDQYVKNGNLPGLCMLRVMRDHTSGTAAGASSARAMVADNDYAVGEIVEAISHSPYWKSSAIVIVEDDAQNGYDHVDAHRSTAYVISPYIKPGAHDSRFYNTDSALRTIEAMLGMPPMTQYDAIAPVIDDFAPTAVNDAPYNAILPAVSILAEVNNARAYRSADSTRMLNPLKEESEPDEELNDILWHSIKGVNVPAPARRYSLSAPHKDADGDGDGD